MKLRIPHTHDEQGQSLLEFGLVIGFLFVFLLGMVDIANALRQKSDLDQVVRQAARQAGELGGDVAQVESYIETQVDMMGYEPSDATISIFSQSFNESTGEIEGNTGADCEYGEFVTVSVSMDWDVSVPTFLFFQLFQDGGTMVVKHTHNCWRS